MTEFTFIGEIKMIQEHHDTNCFEQIYECQDCEAIAEEKKLTVIRLIDRFILRCPVCNSEQIKCIGDLRGG